MKRTRTSELLTFQEKASIAAIFLTIIVLKVLVLLGLFYLAFNFFLSISQK